METVLEARRKEGRFKSLAGFARAVDLKALNHKVFECLIKSGSFDSFGAHRSALFESLDRILEYAQGRQRDAEHGQNALFSSEAMPEPSVNTDVPPWPDRERLSYENEVLAVDLEASEVVEFSAFVGR